MASTGTFVNPGSVLARTAREMVQAHAGGAGPSEGMTNCPVCGEPLPCSSGRAAAEVLFAAGLAESSGLVAAYRESLGSPAASPYGAPEPGPQAGASPFGLPDPGPQAGASPFPASAESPVVSFDKPPYAEDGPGYGDLTVVEAGPVTPAAAPAVAEDSAAPDDRPDGDELSLSEPPSPWSPTRKAAKTPVVRAPKTPVVRAPKTPPPAETARGSARPVSEQVVPVREPEPEPEIDPLLLGPPLFAQQNRPLDAPRFTRTARPATQPHPGTQQDLSSLAQPHGAPRPAQPAAAAGKDPILSSPIAADPILGGPVPGPAAVATAVPGPAAFATAASGQAVPGPAEEPPVTDPSQAGGWPASSGPLVYAGQFGPAIGPGPEPAGQAPVEHPGVADHFGLAGHPGLPEHPGLPDHVGVAERPSLPEHVGVSDHPGEPGHPGVLDLPAEPQPSAHLPLSAQPPAHLPPPAHVPPPAPPSGRAPLEAPQMGQLNRGLEPAAEKPPAKPPIEPAIEPGRQTDTAPQTRPPRPPLEAPQLGQLNRPLEPADRRPIGDEPTGSGLPGRPEKVEMNLVTPAMPAPWAVGEDDSSVPSGLLSPPPPRPESPSAEQAAEEDVPSGLPHRTEQP